MSDDDAWCERHAGRRARGCPECAADIRRQRDINATGRDRVKAALRDARRRAHDGPDAPALW